LENQNRLFEIGLRGRSGRRRGSRSPAPWMAATPSGPWRRGAALFPRRCRSPAARRPPSSQPWPTTTRSTAKRDGFGRRHTTDPSLVDTDGHSDYVEYLDPIVYEDRRAPMKHLIAKNPHSVGIAGNASHRPQRGDPLTQSPARIYRPPVQTC